MSLVPGQAQAEPTTGLAGRIWVYFETAVTAVAYPTLTVLQTASLRKLFESISSGVIDEINANFAGGGGSFYQTIKNAASSLTQRAFLKFDGTLIRATDDGTNTVVDPFGLVPATRQVSAGSGLSGGGDLSADRTLSIPNGGVTNAMLANNSVTYSPGQGLQNAGTVALGSSATINLKLNSLGGLVKNLGTGTDELGIGAGGVTSAMLASSALGSSLTSGYVPYATGSNAVANSGVYWDSANSRAGIGTSSPAEPLDIRNSSNIALLHLRSNGTTDDGGYLRGGAADTLSMSGGAKGRADGWEARATSATLMEFGSGGLTVYGNAGLTVGILYDPTQRWALAADGTVTMTNKLTGLTQATGTTDAVAGGRTLTAGSGLTGGGNLTADRSLSIASGGVTPSMLGSGVAVPTTGQKYINVIDAGTRTSYSSTTPFVVGSLAINASDYTVNAGTLSAVFRAIAATGTSGLTVHVQLYNVTDAVSISILNFTTTTETKAESTLTIGTSAGNLINNAEKVYEIRVYVDSPATSNDTIELYDAELRMINTF